MEAYNNGEVDFSGVTTINLDEYRGIKRNHEQSYWSFMQENLFKHVNVREDHIFIPNGENLNSEEVCREYDKIIENAGGIDMQLLGIGLDGHIGFNEPGEAFEKETHCVDLTQSTIEASNMISKDVLVISWENHYQNVYDLLKNGFKVINCSWQPLYVVSGIFEHERYHFEDILDWNVYLSLIHI